ncbi:uncharacterized protein LOC141886489 [Acropora palmata]|uniref:uncharacterized protein LOC141886489 n=1 Tax=Acropora palmata TaxID=6131 RepID=UPI003DA1BA3C
MHCTSNESTTPDRARSEILFRAGLGRLRVVFPNKNASHDELQRFLEDKFPKLKAGGGFEVLRAAGGGGGQRSLIPVLPTREGYTVPHLKETLSSAVGFFRPLQADLDESPAIEDESGPTVKCIHCNKEFYLMEVKKHVNDCSSKPKRSSVRCFFILL